MHSAPNLVLVGPMGAGKSSIGRRLASRFGLRFVDVDHEIEATTGASVTAIFDCEGEAGFRARESRVLERLMGASRCVIATGGGAVLDADNRRLMRERGFVIHMHADVGHQLARLARDRSRPLLAGDDRETVLARLAIERAPLYAEVAHLVFDTGDHQALESAVELGHLVERHWRCASPDASSFIPPDPV